VAVPSTTRDLIIQEENFKNEVYPDAKGFSAGYGHFLSDEELERYPPGAIVPQGQLDEWFEADLQKAYDAALAQNKQLQHGDVDIARLTSVNYQLGSAWNDISVNPKAFEDTWNSMLAGDWAKASKQALDSDWAEWQSSDRANKFSSALAAMAMAQPAPAQPAPAQSSPIMSLMPGGRGSLPAGIPSPAFMGPGSSAQEDLTRALMGGSRALMGAQQQDLLPETWRAPPTTLGGVFGTSVKAGTAQLRGDVQTFGAIFNLLSGNDEGAERKLNRAKQHAEYSGELLSSVGEFKEFLDAPTFPGFMRQVTRAIGQFTPMALSSVASGLSGAAIGVAGRGVLSAASKKYSRKLLRELVKKHARGEALAPDEKAILNSAYETLHRVNKFSLQGKYSVYADIIKTGHNYQNMPFISGGFWAGAFGQEYVVGSAQALSEYEDAGYQLTAEEARTALALGIPQAVIGTLGERLFAGAMFKKVAGAVNKARRAGGIPVNQLSKRVGELPDDAKSAVRYLREIGKGFGEGLIKGGLQEGITETVQEELFIQQRMAIDPEYSQQEANLRRAESAFAGFWAGGGRSAIATPVANVIREARRQVNDGRNIRDDVRNEERVGKTSQIEPAAWGVAQTEAMLNPKTSTGSVWLPTEGMTDSQIDSFSEGYIKTVEDTLGKETADSLSIERDPEGRGILVFDKTKDDLIQQADRNAFREFGPTEENLKNLLGYTEVTKPEHDLVVAVRDKEGNVVWYQTIDEAGRKKAEARAAQRFPDREAFPIEVMGREEFAEEKSGLHEDLSKTGTAARGAVRGAWEEALKKIFFRGSGPMFSDIAPAWARPPSRARKTTIDPEASMVTEADLGPFGYGKSFVGAARSPEDTDATYEDAGPQGFQDFDVLGQPVTIVEEGTGRIRKPLSAKTDLTTRITQEDLRDLAEKQPVLSWESGFDDPIEPGTRYEAKQRDTRLQDEIRYIQYRVPGLDFPKAPAAFKEWTETTKAYPLEETWREHLDAMSHKLLAAFRDAIAPYVQPRKDLGQDVPGTLVERSDAALRFSVEFETDTDGQVQSYIKAERNPFAKNIDIESRLPEAITLSKDHRLSNIKNTTWEDPETIDPDTKKPEIITSWKEANSRKDKYGNTRTYLIGTTGTPHWYIQEPGDPKTGMQSRIANDVYMGHLVHFGMQLVYDEGTASPYSSGSILDGFTRLNEVLEERGYTLLYNPLPLISKPTAPKKSRPERSVVQKLTREKLGRTLKAKETAVLELNAQWEQYNKEYDSWAEKAQDVTTDPAILEELRGRIPKPEPEPVVEPLPEPGLPPKVKRYKSLLLRKIHYDFAKTEELSSVLGAPVAPAYLNKNGYRDFDEIQEAWTDQGLFTELDTVISDRTDEILNLLETNDPLPTDPNINAYREWEAEVDAYDREQSELAAEPAAEPTVVETVPRFSKALLKSNPDKVYLFGDNLRGRGKGGQAIIRDEPNALGIPTKKAPHTGSNAYFTDAEYDTNIQAIDEAFNKIPAGATVVLPKDGLGTGRAQLEQRAPRTAAYLNSKLEDLRAAAQPAAVEPTAVEPAIDIWAGNNTNTWLSNFAKRPFTSPEGRRYISAEHAYQSNKTGTFNQKVWEHSNWREDVAVGENAGRFRGTGKAHSKHLNLLENVVRASFEANPEEKQALIDTGNAELTHKQSPNPFWTREFPKILTKVRAEFQAEAVQPAAAQPLATTVLHSGGAKGADTVWGTIGSEYGISEENTKHYWMKGGSKPPQGNVLLTEEQKEEARPHVKQAAASMRERGDNTRSPPSSSLAVSLIHRNWFQVKNSDAVFAITKGGLNPTRTLIKPDRGTPWAVEMGINQGKPVYVFAQGLNQWFTWDGSKFIETETPTLTPNFAGVGTRGINEAGRQAIRNVYEKSTRKPAVPRIKLLEVTNFQNAPLFKFRGYAPGRPERGTAAEPLNDHWSITELESARARDEEGNVQTLMREAEYLEGQQAVAEDYNNRVYAAQLAFAEEQGVAYSDLWDVLTRSSAPVFSVAEGRTTGEQIPLQVGRQSDLFEGDSPKVRAAKEQLMREGVDIDIGSRSFFTREDSERLDKLKKELGLYAVEIPDTVAEMQRDESDRGDPDQLGNIRPEQFKANRVSSGRKNALDDREVVTPKRDVELDDGIKALWTGLPKLLKKHFKYKRPLAIMTKKTAEFEIKTARDIHNINTRDLLLTPRQRHLNTPLEGRLQEFKQYKSLKDRPIKNLIELSNSDLPLYARSLEIALENMAQEGGLGQYIGFGDRDVIIIDNPESFIGPAQQVKLMYTLGHETGHALFHQELRRSLDFRGWHNRLEAAFQEAKKRSGQYQGPHGFEEWYSDQTSIWLLNPDKEAKTGIDSMFKRLANKIRDIFKQLNIELKKRFGAKYQSQTFTDYMNATVELYKNETIKNEENLSFSEQVEIRNMIYNVVDIKAAEGGWTKNVVRRLKKNVLDLLSDNEDVIPTDRKHWGVKFFLTTAHNFLVRGSFHEQSKPIAKALAAILYTPSQTTDKPGFLNSKPGVVNRWRNRLFELAPTKANWSGLQQIPDLEAFAKILTEAERDVPKAQLRPEARKVREFLDEFYEKVITNIDSTILRRKNFFPRMLAIYELQQNPEAREKLVKLLERENPNAVFPKGGKVDFNKVVEKLISKNEPNLENPVDDDGANTDGIGDISLGTSRQRTEYFKNITNKQLREIGVLENPLVVIDKYVGDMTKRMDYDQHAQTVVTAEDIAKALLDNEQGNSLKFLLSEDVGEGSIVRGWKAAEVLLQRIEDPSDRAAIRSTYSAMIGKTGLKISPMARQINSLFLTINIVSYLTFATLASLPDLAGPILRSKDFTALGVWFHQWKHYFNNREEMQQFGRDVGVISFDSLSTSLMNAQEMGYMTPAFQRGSDLFFRSIGLEAFTNFTRVFALGMGEQFLVRTAQRASDTSLTQVERDRAVRHLAELQVSKEDIAHWSNNQREGTKFRTFEDEQGKRVRQALFLFVEESIVRPNAAERPTWASNPYTALIWQLKSFFYAYGKNIVGGAFREGMNRYSEDGTITSASMPLVIGALTILPLTIIGLEIREWLKFLARGGDASAFRSDSMPWGEYTMEIIDRSGALGAVGLVLPMLDADEFGGEWWVPPLGPTAERFEDLIKGDFRIKDVLPWVGSI